MTKNQSQLEDLKQQVEEMQQTIAHMEKEQKEKELSPWEICKPLEEGFSFHGYLNETVMHTIRFDKDDMNIFKTRKTAEGFANAFRVMVALRQCEGLGFGEDRCGWVIGEHGSSNCYAFSYSSVFSLFPAFKSSDHALAAYKKVGPEKVLAAYKFLAKGE